MNDDLGLFSDADRDAPATAAERARRRTKRRLTWFTCGAVLAALALLVYYGAGQLLGIGGFGDYDGDGSGRVVVQVEDGQSTSEIAATLADADVVKTARAFTSAGSENENLLSVQPGFYAMHHKMSGDAAVKLITDPSSRVGALQIKPGDRLDDTTVGGGKVNKGILSQLADAGCADSDGESGCVSADELRKTVDSTNLKDLGVPAWAVEPAQRVDAKHRLEGLIAPGVYDVKPGSSATDLLKSVLTTSAQQFEAQDITGLAKKQGKTPYELLTVASLVQAEGITEDFEKVSRVVYNRLEEKQKLEFDSTVNYVLDRPEIRTTPEDRDRSGPYNTYQNIGLPPSPISSASKDALQAAGDPSKGDWLFFVKCEKDGRSCFAKTLKEHQANVKSAQDRGVF